MFTIICSSGLHERPRYVRETIPILPFHTVVVCLQIIREELFIVGQVPAYHDWHRYVKLQILDVARNYRYLSFKINKRKSSAYCRVTR